MNIAFSKIAASKDGAHLKWVTTEGKSEISHEIESGEAPRPSFVKAMQVFGSFVLLICQLPEDYRSDLEVTSLSISTNAKSGRRGLVITAKRSVEQANSPFLLHTPHLSETVDNADGRGGFLVGMGAALIEVEKEAEAYIDGARSQVEMFTEDKPASKPALEVTTGNGGQTGDRSIARGRGKKVTDAEAGELKQAALTGV